MDKLNKLISYIDIHRISLWQDLDKLNEQMELLDENSKDYKDLDFEYNSISGQIISLGHVLDYIENDLDISLTKGVK